MKNRANFWRKLLVLVLMAFIVNGCTSKMDHVSTPVLLPPSFSQSGTEELTGKWWELFEDPLLNSLIEQALKNNFSLQSSWNRLSQARATLRKSSASLLPSIDGEGGGTHTITREDKSTTKSDQIVLGLSAQYEIDLWGRIDSAVDAARLDAMSTEDDLDAAAMTLAAEVATIWYQLVQQNCSLKLLEKQIGTNTKGLTIVSSQFRAGQVPLADYLQQKQLVEAKMGERVQLVAAKALSEHQLTLLLGEVPGTKVFKVPEELIPLPSLPDTGIPASTLFDRPDVRSAYNQVAAADMRVAEAIADQYPALRLSFSIETLGSSSDLFNNFLTSIIANLAGPLFDGGQRRAEVDRTRAAAEETLNQYGTVILTAAGEVEDALIQEKQQGFYIESLKTQQELASQSVSQLKDRYLKGVESYQRVLSAVISLQNLEQSVLSAQEEQIIYRIQLCRALGSGWNYSTHIDKKKNLNAQDNI